MAKKTASKKKSKKKTTEWIRNPGEPDLYWKYEEEKKKRSKACA